MSELQTHHDPEVLTGHTEIICSTNIERIVTGRNAALQQIDALVQQLNNISSLTSNIGGGTAQDWATQQGHRYDCWFTEKTETAMKAITHNIDRSLWRDLMLKSGMLALMDAQARDQWHKNLEEGDLSEISEANIMTTFEQLHQSKGDVFERGVVNIFKGLSWDYKSNRPCSFGKKIVVNNLVKYNRWGFCLNWGWRRNQLADLERMLFLPDGKPIPDNRGDVTTRLSAHITQRRTPEIFDDEYFTIRYYQKGSGHIMFKRADLVDKMNDIVAKHYQGMLAEL